MMADGARRDRGGDRRIELEPPARPEATAPEAAPVGRHGDYGGPIPGTPLHLCPQCDYILTGLISRRCPECGRPFTLPEARRAADRHSPRHRRDARAVLWARVSLGAGLFLLLAGLVVPMVVFRGTGAPWGVWMSAAAALSVVLAAMYKGYLQKSLADAAVMAGLIMVGIAAMLTILFW